MNSKDFLTIRNSGNKNSNEFGLYVDTPPMFRMAQQKTSVINIPGREESLYITHDEFEDITMPVTGYIFDNSYDISALYTWLRKAERISFNSNPTRYLRVKKVNGITPNYQGNGKSIITINFVVSPFRYFTDDPEAIFTSKEFTINNGGNYFCRPVYEINGNGVVSIENGTEKLTILGAKDGSGNYKGVEGKCLVDATRLIVHKDGVMLKTDGIIPLLQSGNNSIKITGNTTSVRIARNQRDV